MGRGLWIYIKLCKAYIQLLCGETYPPISLADQFWQEFSQYSLDLVNSIGYSSDLYLYYILTLSAVLSPSDFISECFFRKHIFSLIYFLAT